MRAAPNDSGAALAPCHHPIILSLLLLDGCERAGLLAPEDANNARCVEMRPGSTFLNNLNATDETRATPRYATWWSACAAVIEPDSSTPLSDAVNTQTACLSHSALYSDATVYGHVRSWVHQ